ncbi:hypothetical protein Tco_0558559 [Tanacetum coccineum]
MLEHCYNILKDHQGWLDVEMPTFYKTQRQKKSKTFETTSGSASDGINLNDEADEAVEETQEVRLMGRDQTKAKKKSPGSSRGGSSSFVDLVANKFLNIKQKKIGKEACPDGRDARIEGTSGWKAIPDGRHVRMEGTSGWKGRQMERTSGWKARPDGRHVRMEGTPGWKGRLDERHTALTIRLLGTSLLPSGKSPSQIILAPSFYKKDGNLEGATNFFRHSQGTSGIVVMYENSSTLGHVIGEFINKHGELVVIEKDLSLTTPKKQLYRLKFNPDMLQPALPSLSSITMIWTSGRLILPEVLELNKNDRIVPINSFEFISQRFNIKMEKKKIKYRQLLSFGDITRETNDVQYVNEMQILSGVSKQEFDSCLLNLTLDVVAVAVAVAVVKVEEIEEQSGSQMNVEKLRKMASVVRTGRKGSMRSFSSFWEDDFLKADDAFIHSILTCSWFQDGRISYEEFQVIIKTGTAWRKASLGSSKVYVANDTSLRATGEPLIERKHETVAILKSRLEAFDRQSIVMNLLLKFTVRINQIAILHSAETDKEGNASVTYILGHLEKAKLTPKVFDKQPAPDEISHVQM